MNKNNICKLFIGSVLISMLLGGATRLMNNRIEFVVQAKANPIATIAEVSPEHTEANDDVFTYFNDIYDGEFVKA